MALDPGVRTFQTCYDTDGNVTEWGVGDMNALLKGGYDADRLDGRMKKEKNRLYYRFRQ